MALVCGISVSSLTVSGNLAFKCPICRDKEPQVDEQVSEADDKFKTESEIGAEGATSQDALVIEENLMKEREALMSEEEKEVQCVNLEI